MPDFKKDTRGFKMKGWSPFTKKKYKVGDEGKDDIVGEYHLSDEGPTPSASELKKPVKARLLNPSSWPNKFKKHKEYEKNVWTETQGKIDHSFTIGAETKKDRGKRVVFKGNKKIIEKASPGGKWRTTKKVNISDKRKDKQVARLKKKHGVSKHGDRAYTMGVPLIDKGHYYSSSG